MSKNTVRPATTEQVPVPHDVANDSQAPSDPANDGAAVNTPVDPNAADPTPNTLQASLDQLADDVAPNKPSDGTVTLDFGKAGKLTGCLVMNTVPGADLSFVDGQHVTVVVPTGESAATTISVEARYISK